MVILLICSSLVVAAIDQKSEIVYVQTDADIHRMRIGLLLKETTNESTTVALIGAGIIKFYSERYSIDMLGLNDRDIEKIWAAAESKANRSDHEPVAFYYDSRAIELVAKGERFIREKYGYEPPVI